MNDERFVAQQTERERKSIAASARRRKTHNGKSGCTLPHENMSRKELLAMNGEVKEYNLSKPMDWEEFKALPMNLQEAYIYQLVKKYDISIRSFTRMLKVSQPTVSAYMKKNQTLKRLFNSTTANNMTRLNKTEAFFRWAGVIEENETKEEPVDAIVDDINPAEDLPEVKSPEEPQKEGLNVFTDMELELMLLRQKVEIYERILFGKEVD
jgi:hypothetical protein